MMANRMRQNNRGFTLIELAVVLIVVGVLLGSFIGTLASRINVSKKSDTYDELEDIKQSVIAHAYVNGYLPCPDCEVGPCPNGAIGDGQSDYNAAGTCSNGQNAGNVPWVTLGLGHSDAWGNHYRYAVQTEYADSTTAFTLAAPAGTASILEPNYPVDATGGTPHSLADNVVAIIFSHGSNGYGAISAENVARPAVPAANTDEQENDDNDANYYMRPETDSSSNIAGGEFDDIVIWISEYELKAKMVEAGQLP